MSQVTIAYDSASMRFVLTVPGTGPEARPHQVRIPANCNGLTALVRFLQAREAGEPDTFTLGTAASPTQEMVEEFLRLGGQVQRKERASAKREGMPPSILDEVDLSDLDIQS